MRFFLYTSVVIFLILAQLKSTVLLEKEFSIITIPKYRKILSLLPEKNVYVINIFYMIY